VGEAQVAGVGPRGAVLKAESRSKYAEPPEGEAQVAGVGPRDKRET
jgi:hypothetical protein